MDDWMYCEDSGCVLCYPDDDWDYEPFEWYDV